MLDSRRGISRRMVGRDDALTELRQLLDGARATDGPVVAMVTGEAGIGKTRLVRELIAITDASPSVIAGQAREGDTRRSFALLRDAVEEHLDPTGAVPDAVARWRHPLGHLLEPLVAMPEHPRDGHEHVPEELERAGVALLRHLADPGPAIVAVEDLHWADAESLGGLARLARSDARMLLLGTFRPEEFDRRHPLAELLAGLERQGPVSHLAVEGLTRAELAAFLEEVCGEPAGTATVERLHRRTRGNPFFLEELLATIEPQAITSQRGGIVDAAMLVDAPLPWSTNEAALRRLERYDETTRGLLQTAAVLGDRFDADLLAGVLDEDVERLLPRLASLVRDGVLVEHTATIFAFRHALTWEAAAGELLAAERRDIHARALDVLAADDDAAPATLARHALAAGRLREVAGYAGHGAHRAAHGGAPREALHLAQMSLEHDAEQVDMHELVTRAASQLGEFDEASRHAELWRVLASDAADLEGEALAGCHLALARWWAGEHEASRDALHAALAVVEELDDSPVRAEVLATHARQLMVGKRPTEAVTRADEAITAAERAGDRRMLARAWLYKCAGILDSPDHQNEADLQLAATLIDRAREESARLGDADTLAGALHNRLVPDQPDDFPLEWSWQLLAEAREAADRYGIERLANKLTVLEAHLAVADGEQQRAEHALASARRVVLASAEANWRSALDALLGLESGDLERAEAAHEAQHDLLGEPYQSEAEVDVLVVEAAIAAHRRDTAGAEAALRRAGPAVQSVCICVAANWWEMALSALDAGVSPSLVRELMERDAPASVARHAGLIAHTSGALLAAEGRRDEAVDALREALANERRGRRATLLADAHHRLADLLGAQGDRGRARAHATEALTLLDRWPGPRRARTEALLRRLGDGTASTHELFTARELEVIKLVARGYTNSDIAQRLFITRKTAATHVSNVLSKTGFERRTQVAVWALEEGLADRSD